MRKKGRDGERNEQTLAASARTRTSVMNAGIASNPKTIGTSGLTKNFEKKTVGHIKRRE